MNRLFLAAALTFCLAGCHRRTDPTPVTAAPTAVSVVDDSVQSPRSEPVPAKNALAPIAPATTPPTVAALEPDGGVPDVGQPPPDPLALDHEPDNADHLALAQQLRTDGDLPGALVEARKALADGPNDEDALMLAGRLASRTGDFDLADEAFGRLAKLEPQDAAPAIEQARVLLSAGKYDEAILAANDAISRDDENAEAYQALGRAYLNQKKLAPAITAFEKAVQLDPDHGYALNNLGLCYLRTGQNDKAVELLSRAAEELPDVAFVQNNLGLALERTGKKADAEAAFVRAMSLSPKYLKARINSGKLERLASVEVPDPSTPIDDAAPDLELDPLPLPGSP